MLDLSRFRKAASLGCAVFFSTAMLVLAQPAHLIPTAPATWTVNTTADPGAPTCAVTCSLRAAVNASAPGDIIVFNAAVFSVPQTIILGRQIEISQSLTIDGLTMGGITPTISGNHMTRTLQVDAGASVTLNALNLVDGYCYQCDGGGIYNRGTLSITSSVVSGNATSHAAYGTWDSGGAGGGIFNVGTLFLAHSLISQNHTGQGSCNGAFHAGAGGAGGGIYTSGTLTILNSVVSENTTGIGGVMQGCNNGNGGSGGGIYNAGMLIITDSILSANNTGNGGGDSINISIGGNGGDGGGVYNNGALAIMNSTLHENRTGRGGETFACSSFCSPGSHGGNGGGVYNAGTLSIKNSTVSGNATGKGGNRGNESAPPYNEGGDGGNGGGIWSYQDLSLLNDTIAGNEAGAGGSGYTGGAGGSGGGIFSGLAVSITNSTISGNAIGHGGAGYVDGSSGNGDGIYWLGTALLKNTLIVNGSSEANCAVSSFQADGGYNLDSGDTCGFTTTNHSLINTNPLLGVMGNYGGPVQTMPLLPGSPAIDAIPFGENGCGTAITTDARGMPRPQGTACDIGAFEGYLNQFLLPVILR
jgi:hypothetical protein